MSDIGYKSFDENTPDIDLSNALEQMAIEHARNLRMYTLLTEAARRLRSYEAMLTTIAKEKQPE